MSGRRDDAVPVDTRSNFQKFQDWYYSVPVLTRNFMVAVLVLYLFTLFGAIPAIYLVNEPWLVLGKFQLWRPLTSLFVTGALLAVVITLYLVYAFFGELEKGWGTVQAAWLAVTVHVLVTILYDVLALGVMFTFAVPGGRTMGFTVVFFFAIAVRCYSDPEASRPFCGVAVQNKFYPLVLLLIFALIFPSGLPILLQLMAVGAGYLDANRRLEWIRLSADRIASIERKPWLSGLTSAPMFVPVGGARDPRDARAARESAEAQERGESRAGSVFRQGNNSSSSAASGNGNGSGNGGGGSSASAFTGGGQVLGRGDPSQYENGGASPLVTGGNSSSSGASSAAAAGGASTAGGLGGPMGDGTTGARGKLLGRGRARVDAELRREWDERTRNVAGNNGGGGDNTGVGAGENAEHFGAVGSAAPSGRISQVDPGGRLATEREKAALAAEERLRKQRQERERNEMEMQAIAPLPPPEAGGAGGDAEDEEEAEEIDLLA